jgi:hypothetical protein
MAAPRQPVTFPGWPVSTRVNTPKNDDPDLRKAQARVEAGHRRDRPMNVRDEVTRSLIRGLGWRVTRSLPRTQSV